MRLARFLAVSLLLFPLCSANAESTAVRTKQLLAAIASDDADLVEKLLGTPELSVNQKYGQNYTWTHAAAQSCSTLAMIRLRKLGVPFTGDEGDIVVWQMDDPEKTEKCSETAALALSDWRFGEDGLIPFLFDHSEGECIGIHGNGIALRYLISHGALPEEDSADRNPVQGAAMMVHFPQCLNAFKSLFVVFHHPAEIDDGSPHDPMTPLKPAYDGPADWVLDDVTAVDRFGNRAIDLVGPIFVHGGITPEQQRQYSANWTVARNILLKNGSPAARPLTRVVCLQEAWAPNPVGQHPATGNCP